MDARSALFDLYGDHLRSRGAQAPVAALVRLLASIGITAPAVRTAISRMVRQGWLEPVRVSAGAGYALTPRATRRLDEAAERIYSRGNHDWDGGWHLVVVERVRERTRRERVQASLRYLGYAQLDETTWLSPRPSPELQGLREAERIRVEPFAARYDGDPRGLLARAWDLDGLARAYLGWLAEARELIAPVSPVAGHPSGPESPAVGHLSSPESPAVGHPSSPERTVPDEVIFAARSKLVHEWRKFLFRDPGLPAELLPDEWPGLAAAEFFNVESARLLPAASRFVDCCLRAADGRSAHRPEARQ
ncbi:MAG TPA: PaaX family transcriptional regulator C-terminal domain-containing protein [Streptosporangiaceae bacterium]|nr:PaaX family transcriptional regulator C-terminal domain-containing protein [Streptosporangiaceae bacterium]